ncbi:MAG: hypothetical protein CVV42_07555 [Candidatus Riflebacteria bacterium HGW-Riflebacteria-2]|nr:MAG: hypothetical protein CVV42_07555 [Candidatus Riflebacteria bacterium HGW-Riflebacteria-2]
MSGKIDYNFTGKVMTASISGYAEKSLMNGLVETFHQKLEENFCDFVFNFAEMTQINSSALGELLEIASQGMGRDNIRILFCAIPSACRLGMLSLGLLNFVEEHDSIEMALASL